MLKKISSNTGQTSSQLDAHSNELQSPVLTQQNKRFTPDIKTIGVTQFYNSVELNLLINTEQQLKHH